MLINLGDGHYKEYAAPLLLDSNNSFEYFFYNDDLGSSKYGSGTVVKFDILAADGHQIRLKGNSIKKTFRKIETVGAMR